MARLPCTVSAAVWLTAPAALNTAEPPMLSVSSM
jgi:hypothetical protein